MKIPKASSNLRDRLTQLRRGGLSDRAPFAFGPRSKTTENKYANYPLMDLSRSGESVLRPILPAGDGVHGRRPNRCRRSSLLSAPVVKRVAPAVVNVYSHRSCRQLSIRCSRTRIFQRVLAARRPKLRQRVAAIARIGSHRSARRHHRNQQSRCAGRTKHRRRARGPARVQSPNRPASRTAAPISP